MIQLESEMTKNFENSCCEPAKNEQLKTMYRYMNDKSVIRTVNTFETLGKIKPSVLHTKTQVIKHTNSLLTSLP